jgi:hypothetical protein
MNVTCKEWASTTDLRLFNKPKPTKGLRQKIKKVNGFENN